MRMTLGSRPDTRLTGKKGQRTHQGASRFGLAALGLNVGAVGLLPYLPLPTKLLTAVLPPMQPEEGEDVVEFAGRVEVAMQKRLTELARQRRA